MAIDLLPQTVNLFLHADIPDREDELLDSHLLIDQVIGIWIKGLLASFQRRLKVLAWKRHRLAILFHELTQLRETCMECGKLLDEPCDLCFGVLVGICVVINMLILVAG